MAQNVINYSIYVDAKSYFIRRKRHGKVDEFLHLRSNAI